MSKQNGNKIFSPPPSREREGGLSPLNARGHEGYRQDLATLNVRLERILEAQTEKVASAAAEAVRSHLSPLEEQVRQLQHHLLPLRHLYAGPLDQPGMVASEEVLVPVSEPVSASRSGAPGPPEASKGLRQSAVAAEPTRKSSQRSQSKKVEIAEASEESPAKLRVSFSKQTNLSKARSPGTPIKLAKSVTSYHLEESELPWYRFICFRVVRNSYFELLVMITLLLSSATLGLETHLAMQNIHAETGVVFRVFDITWVVAFLLELSLRIVADGRMFFAWENPEFGWNATDTFFVAISTADELIVLLGMDIELSQFRLLRMIRLVRVLRLLRVVRFCSDLRIMVNGIAGSARVLFWALVLLAIVVFIFGVTLMQLAYAHLKTEPTNPEDVAKYYGSLGRSMLTLFMAVSGGIDWKDAVAPLGPLSWLIDYFMGIYVFFTLFCFINVITGIFVDNAKALSETEAIHQRSALALKRKIWVKKVLALFAQLDSGQEGDLSYEEFAAEIQDERVQDCFRHLGINVENHTVDELFDLFDRDADGNIDQAAFEQAIRQFHGAAKSIDIFKLRRETQKISKQVRSLLQVMDRAQGGGLIQPPTVSQS
mmetsp:Transcript_39799/g.92087  ORF Transcript_39799/g.92087 Transcript_39799/m.92087 type:complete len:599 (+) Transcript_39799:61-1857(+)